MYIVGKDYCPWCNKAKQLLKNKNIKHEYLLLNNEFADYMKIFTLKRISMEF